MKKISEEEASELKNLLIKQGSLEMRVITGSMSPVIPAGTSIVVEPLKTKARKNDIIVFFHRDILLCHLVFHINELSFDKNQSTYSTRGLCNLHEDFPCTEDKVIGLVTSHRLTLLQRLRLAWLRI